MHVKDFNIQISFQLNYIKSYIALPPSGDQPTLCHPLRKNNIYISSIGLVT
jgi:hypothetical protein